MCRLVLALCLFPLIGTGQAYKSISVDSRQQLVLLDTSGNVVQVPTEEGQKSVDLTRLSPDHRIAGWAVSIENCCTSYPIPIALVLFRDGKVVQRFSDRWMVYQWKFRNGSKQIVMETGTVHGMEVRHLMLFDVESGRKLKDWTGNLGTSPIWGKSLKLN